MNILIVYSHPSKNSFTFQVFEKFKQGLSESGHEIIVSDLYAMDFKSDMTEEEYSREGFANTRLVVPEDIKAEQQKIEKADCMVFIYPLWWSDCPAKMKGWFDRVFTVGYAYGYDENGKPERKMKKIKYGMVICTAGHSNDFLDKAGIAESMRNIMIDDRLGVRFANKKMIVLGNTLHIKDVRGEHLKTAYETGKRIEESFSQ
jgi:NAD(P)H dehydrogenase (quinone)